MREKGLILCQLIITFALTVCLSACGEDKEEVKQNDDVILGVGQGRHSLTHSDSLSAYCEVLGGSRLQRTEYGQMGRIIV